MMDVWCEAMREDRMVLLCGGGGESANVEDGSVHMRRAVVSGESSDAVCVQKLLEISVGSQMIRSTHAPTHTNTRSFKVMQTRSRKLEISE